jgi:ERCC4-related helicase
LPALSDTLIEYPDTRVVLLVHVREFIEQNLEKLLPIWPEAPIGVHSAGLGKHELGQPVLFCGIHRAWLQGRDGHRRRERDKLVSAFRRGEIRRLTNANVLTAGLDAPIIDLIALLRPTESPGLYVQMLDRGMRLAPGKRDYLVLAFADDIARHGPVDQVRVRALEPNGGVAGKWAAAVQASSQKCHPTTRVSLPSGTTTICRGVDRP